MTARRRRHHHHHHHHHHRPYHDDPHYQHHPHHHLRHRHLQQQGAIRCSQGSTCHQNPRSPGLAGGEHGRHGEGPGWSGASSPCRQDEDDQEGHAILRRSLTHMKATARSRSKRKRRKRRSRKGGCDRSSSVQPCRSKPLGQKPPTAKPNLRNSPEPTSQPAARRS